MLGLTRIADYDYAHAEYTQVPSCIHERERERDLVNFETEFHARPRGGLLVTVHLLLTLTLPALA